MSSGGIHYLKYPAAALGISVPELINRARAYRCRTCGSHFCDPWLSRELASALFCSDSPDHIAGWTKFEGWLRNSDALGERTRKLYTAVTRRTGPLQSYAEFGCPFQGFLLESKAHEAEAGTRLDLFAGAVRRGSDVRWSRYTRVYNALENVLRVLFVFGLRISVRVGMLARGGRVTKPTDPITTLPGRRYLLTQDTTKGWGSNCVRYGASCQYFAHSLLGADVIPLEEAASNPRARFDLIGAFNTFDHTSLPLNVLGMLTAMSDHVLIVTHSVREAGKQHLYALGDDFPAWLAATHHLQVEDLGPEVNDGKHDYGCWLLSTTPGAPPAAGRTP